MGGGPRTQMGRGQPLVYILGHAFKIGAVNLAPFNRDASTLKTVEGKDILQF